MTYATADFDPPLAVGDDVYRRRILVHASGFVHPTFRSSLHAFANSSFVACLSGFGGVLTSAMHPYASPRSHALR